jgi:hypothetical protein
MLVALKLENLGKLKLWTVERIFVEKSRHQVLSCMVADARTSKGSFFASQL